MLLILDQSSLVACLPSLVELFLAEYAPAAIFWRRGTENVTLSCISTLALPEICGRYGYVPFCVWIFIYCCCFCVQ